MEGDTLSQREMNSICLAFSYLHGPDCMNHILHNQTVFIRFSIYKSIMGGLQHLQPIANDSDASYIEELQEKVLVFQTNYKMDALCEVSTEIKDEFNLEDLLKLLRSDEDLEKKLSNCIIDQYFNDKLECYELLKYSWFFESLYDIVLCWSVDQQKRLMQGLQKVVSKYNSTNESSKESLIVSMSTWLLDMTEKKLSKYLWKDLKDLYHVAELVLKAVSNGECCCKNESGFEHTDLLQMWLIFIQVVEINNDVSSVLSMMIKTSPDQWLNFSLVQNFLVVCVEQFDIS